MVSAKDVHSLLAGFGITPSDKVAVHSALRAVGPIERGADGLIDAFCSYLTEGLLLIPTHTWRFFSTLYYDVKATEPCLGALSTVAAFRQDGVRSLHPSHSVTAFGKCAEAYVAGEEHSETVTPPTSALGRLYEEKGKILLIGVNHTRNTYLHTVEERLDVKNRLHPEGFVFTIKTATGETLTSSPIHPFYSEGIPGGASEYFENYKKPLEECGAVTYGRLGNATVYCCDAVKTFDVLKMLWERADYDLCASHREIPTEYYKSV